MLSLTAEIEQPGRKYGLVTRGPHCPPGGRRVRQHLANSGDAWSIIGNELDPTLAAFAHAA
jgi:hypothetical protein